MTTTPTGRDNGMRRQSEMLSRISWLSDVLVNDPGPSRLSLVADRIIADLDVAAVSVWVRGTTGAEMRLLGSSGDRDLLPAASIGPRDAGIALTMLPPGLQPVDWSPLFPGATGSDRWHLAAPVRSGRRLIGLVCLMSAVLQPPLAGDDLRWAELLVTVLAAELVEQQRQVLDGQRDRQLQTVIEALPEAAAIADTSARILIANPAFRMQFGLQAESLEIGVDLAALLGQVEYLNDAAGKRSVVPRLRAALSASEATTLPLALTPAAGRGAFRLVLTPVTPTADSDGPTGASLIRLVPPPVRPAEMPNHREADGDTSPGELSVSGLIEIERMIDFVTAVGSGDHLDAVIQSGIDELRDLFGATAGSILLQRDDGMLVRLSPSGFTAPVALETIVDPVRLPSAQTALGERRAVVLRRSTANVHETEALDRAGVDGGLIIPLPVGERVIGLAVLAYFADPAEITPEQVALATALGRYLASALTNARNWDRWGVAQRHLLTVIDQLPQGVLVVDAADGSLVVANRAADELWGQEVQGTADTDDVSALGDAVRERTEGPLLASHLIIHDGNGDPFPVGGSPMERTLRLGERRPAEPLTVVRRDGTTVRVIGAHVPILSDDGRILNGVGVFQDIEQLRAVDRAKDEFLSVVAHELRNPLTSLRGNMQLLQRRLRRQDDPDRAEELDRLDGLVAQTDRINELVGRLLDVSRADLDRTTLECDGLDALEVVTQAVDATRGAQGPGRFVVDVPEQPLPVVWDRVRMRQVLDNLLSNAVKYAGPGEVRVSLVPVVAGQVEIAVSDSGPGIPDAVKGRVFERYYRASPDTSGADGLGIGLYISSRIVAAHGGTIVVTDAPGGGAVFTVLLPVDASGDVGQE